jgi:hypothetical protein
MGFGPWVMIRATLDEIRVFASVRFLPQIFSDDVIPKKNAIGPVAQVVRAHA